MRERQRDREGERKRERERETGRRERVIEEELEVSYKNCPTQLHMYSEL